MNRLEDLTPTQSNKMSFESASRLVGALLADEPAVAMPDGAPTIEGYVLDSLIGRGAGGEVYLAFREDFGDPLAVKVLSRALGSARSDQRAWRELDVLSDLRMPGVPRVLDYGITEGRLYITTTLVEGQTLLDFCKARDLSMQQKAALMADICDLVQGLHERGVIHRDLKPANVMVQHDGKPVIIDFGIAWLLDKEGIESLTGEGDPIGTLGFMAPEQARGEHAIVSTRSDVYSLGAIACQLLARHTPHDVHVAFHEAVRRVAQDPPRNPADLNPELDPRLAQIIERAIAPRPEDRYASATLLADDLRRWVKNEPIPWQRTFLLTRQVLAWRRNPRAFLAKTVIWLLAILCAASMGAAYSQRSVAERERANAVEADRLRVEAQQVAEQKKDWEKKVLETETKRIALRERQVARVKTALAQGQLFDATIVLLNFAEEAKELRPTDREMLDLFIQNLNALIEAAGKNPR